MASGNPGAVHTPEALVRNPEKVCSFYDERKVLAARANPSPAHLALARLEQFWVANDKGKFLLVTQNVDDLHERSGSVNLIHMHGELNAAYCMECGYQSSRHSPLEGQRECPNCEREALRPDIVFFGESPRGLHAIEASLRECDLFVAIGTSGSVYPAAGFANIAREAGARTLCINLESPDYEAAFEIVRLGMAGTAVPEWVESLIG